MLLSMRYFSMHKVLVLNITIITYQYLLRLFQCVELALSVQFLHRCHFFVYQCMHHLGNATQEYLLVSKNWASLFHFTIAILYCHRQLSNIMHALFSYPCWHWRAPSYSKIFFSWSNHCEKKIGVQQHGMHCFHIYLSLDWYWQWATQKHYHNG